MSNSGHAGIIALCLAGLAVNALTLGPALTYTGRGVTDFMQLYAGGKLAFTGDLYVRSRVLETEAGAEGWSSPTRLYNRPPWVALFFRPLAQLGYPAASALWEALCVCSMVAFAALWPVGRRRQIAVACCWSVPLAMTLAEGQDVGLLLLEIAMAAILVRQKRPVAGGIVASLCLAKFHLFVMVPVWICARRQWRFASGILAGCATLSVLAFAAGGWNWPSRYYAVLREPSNNPHVDLMPNLPAFFEGLPHAGVLTMAAIGMLALAVWKISRARAEWGLAAALAGGLLAPPHVYMADCALLIPSALLAMRTDAHRAMRVCCIYLLTPFPWVLLMCGIGIPARLGICGFVLSLGWQALKRHQIGSLTLPQALALFEERLSARFLNRDSGLSS